MNKKGICAIALTFTLVISNTTNFFAVELGGFWNIYYNDDYSVVSEYYSKYYIPIPHDKHPLFGIYSDIEDEEERSRTMFATYEMLKGYKIVTTSIFYDGKICGTADQNIYYTYLRYNGHIDDIENHWAKNYVYFAVARDIAPTVVDGKFYPNQNITRAEFAKVVANLSMEDLSEYNYRVFDDVEEGEFLNAITWASENEIVFGDGSGNFYPNNNITREEMATLFARYILAGYDYPIEPGDGYEKYNDDGEISEWARQNVYAMLKYELMSGYEDNTVRPQNYITRAEVSTIIYNYVESVISSNLVWGVNYETYTIEH